MGHWVPACRTQPGILPMAHFTVYTVGEDEYVGCTGCLTMEDKLEAWRNGSHTKPSWLRSHPHLMQLTPVAVNGHKLTKPDALALEAAITVLKKSKGACWATAKLTPQQRSEWGVVEMELEGCRSHCGMIQAVRKAAKKCDANGPLRLHLGDSCFVCHEAWPHCSCRVPQRTPEPREIPKTRRKSGHPMKSGQTVRNEKTDKWTAEERKSHKRGADPEAARVRDNSKQCSRVH